MKTMKSSEMKTHQPATLAAPLSEHREFNVEHMLSELEAIVEDAQVRLAEEEAAA
ncbi:hypothetical protein GCM10011513_19930 [Franconibacter daqui]|nr:hypothetical protein GCM10011513_19930 [Franconibacter daqui]